jgi:hypothetical protein
MVVGVQRLLDRNPSVRLGSGSDAAEVRAHAWFRAVPWHALEQQSLPAPFVPHVTGLEDTENFEPEFTSMPVGACKLTLPRSLLLSALCPLR